MSVSPAMKRFLHAENFAVVGRVLTDRSRWDNKVLRWYISRQMPVIPIKPTLPPSSSEEAEGLAILSSAADLPDLQHTSISVIINPSIGLDLLRSLYPTSPSAQEPHAVWFQPGADSLDIQAYVQERGIGDRVVMGGACVLVQGDGILAELKEEKRGQSAGTEGLR